MIRVQLYRVLYVAISLTFVLAGCQSKPETVKARSGLSAVKVQRIALMPFVRGLHNSSLGDPMNRLLYCTMSDLCFNIKEVKGNADELMTGFLQEALQKSYAGALIPARLFRLHMQSYRNIPPLTHRSHWPSHWAGSCRPTM